MSVCVRDVSLRRSPTFTRKKVGLRSNEQIRILVYAWLHDFIVDSDCLTVSCILTRLVIGSLTCASLPLTRFQCFDFERGFERSIL